MTLPSQLVGNVQEKRDGLPPARPRGVKGAALAACEVIVEDLGAANVPGVKEGESTLRAFLLARLGNLISLSSVVSNTP